MKASLSSLGLLFIFLGSSSCLPAPRTVQVFPAIQGIVRQAGQPVTDARISAAKESADGDCADTETVTVTDQAGRFSIAPDRDRRWFLRFGDPLASWIVCIEHDGVQYVGWRSYSFGYAPRAVEMQCDLDEPVVDRVGGSGFCRWIAVPSLSRR